MKSFNHVQLFATPWAVARQAPLSMGILQARILPFPSIPFLSPGDRLNLGMKPRPPILQADSLLSEQQWLPFKQWLGDLVSCYSISAITAKASKSGGEEKRLRRS